MRIGLVIYGNLNTRSGGYLYDRKLVEYLRAQGDSVEIISLPVASYSKTLSQNFDFLLLKKLTQLPIDILLQDELNHPSLFLLNVLLKHKVDYRLVGIVHHLRCQETFPPLEKVLYRMIERYFIHTIDGLIFNSQATRESVVDLGYGHKPAVVAVPGADNLEVESQLPHETAHSQNIVFDSENPLRILFVGNIIKRKNLLSLINGLQILRGEPWQLMVVGREEVDREYSEKCKKEVELSQLTDQVHFLGSIQDSELLGHYQQSHILAVPSFMEGYGIVYAEAMRQGVIPLAGKDGGACEIIVDGVNGWLVDPSDAESITKIVRFALDHPILLKQMSLAAQQHSRMFPSWHQTCERIRDFLITQVSN